MIVSVCSLMGLVLGVLRLPVRKSPVGWIVGGFAGGIGISYGFWRVGLNRYDRKVN